MAALTSETLTLQIIISFSHSQVGWCRPACRGNGTDQHRSDPQAGSSIGGAEQETGPRGQQPDQVERQS